MGIGLKKEDKNNVEVQFERKLLDYELDKNKTHLYRE